MRIRGKLNIKPEDIMHYNGVVKAAKDITKRIANELIPTFIVQESLMYFSDKEEFEKCSLIKNFLEGNPTFFIDISRIEWFGTMRSIERIEKNI